MKIVLEYQPWLTEKPYGAYLSGDDPSYLLRRFETEDEARRWCELRTNGKIVAEYELS